MLPPSPLPQVYTVPEFSPCLMQIVLDGGRPMQIRLSGTNNKMSIQYVC